MFNIGASVMVKSFSSSGPDWIPGVIAHKLGPLTYLSMYQEADSRNVV